MRVAAGLLLVASLFQSSPAPAPGVWPPPGVYTPKDGATRPEVITRVEPMYTREAMRATIQGFVTLQFVVETDGSVGPVHVVTSLDPTFGLDAAAVAALKQWRFKPALKDAKPVRALSNLVLTFSIRDLPPPMTLPAGFDPTPASSATEWAHEAVQMNDVLVDFAYPTGWQRQDLPKAILAVDPKSFHFVEVYQPVPNVAPITFPMPIPELARYSETMRMRQSQSGSGMETLAVGQSALGNANWLWIEMESSTLNSQSAPPEVSVAMQATLDGAHMWGFTTSVGSRLIQVVCMAPILKNTTPADREAALLGAQAECSGSVKRISFTAR